MGKPQTVLEFGLVSGLALALIACGSRQEPDLEPTAADNKEEIAKLMVEQLAATDSIHRSVAFGELEAARRSASWLADNAMAAVMPASWQPAADAVRATSQKVAGGKKLADIAESLGGVLRACGACHEQLGVVVFPPEPAPLPAGGNPAMLGHTRAMTHLARGVALPSDDQWQRGVQAIVDGSFELALDPPTPRDAQESDALVAELRDLGQQAFAARTLEARGRIYGQMMSRCAMCHERARLDEP